MNYKSERYVYLRDCTGFLNYSTQNADVGAIDLWKNLDRALDDPSSVIYVQSMGGGYVDLKAQGTSLYEVIDHYATVSKQGDNQYWVYATQSGVSKYLGDARTNSKDQGSPGFNAKGDYIKWSLFPINETDNYLGITPRFHVGGKHYTFYYVAFPFRKVSTGLKFYYVCKVDKEKGIAVVKEITSDIIPAETPLIVECPSATKDGNKIMPVTGGGAVPSDNLLAGVYFCTEERPSSTHTATPFNTSNMRALGVLSNGKLGYISNPNYLLPATANYVDYDNSLPCNSSYLKITSGTPAQLTVMTQEEYNAQGKVNVTSVQLSQTTATLNVGGTVTLTATVKPDNATDKSVTWTSSNTAVATVVDGKVTAVAIGEATITATTADGTNISASCTVKVEPIKVSSVSLSQTSATLNVGGTVTLTATVKPDNATNKAVTWKSSNTAVATVVDGKVTAVALGEATITATTADGTNLSASCVVKVDPIKVTSVTLSQTSATLSVGGTVTLTATVQPGNATNKAVTWKSSNTAVATVVDGKVTAVAPGEATITATTADGTNLSASCSVKVDPVKVTSVTLSQTSATLNVGGTVTLTATVKPDNATNKSVTWKSSNTAVATVVDGKVTAVALGEATITATTADGSNLSATCAVKVDPIKVSSVTLSQTSATLNVGGTVTLTATVKPDNATNKSVTWKSSNTAVATVVDGKVTAVALGEATITATTADGSNLSASCTVKVDPIKVSSVTLSQTSATLNVGGTVTLTATVKPDNATNKAVTWTSSNTAVATVVDGKVTAVALGEATITATTADGTNLSASCTVKVDPIKVSSVTLSQTSATLNVGGTVTLTATVMPDNATNKAVTWKSSNPAVATVVDGKVTAVALGEANITATAADGTNLSASCVVMVNPIKVNSIALSQTSAELFIGSDLQLTVNLQPDNATDKSIAWRSSNPSVATVVDGKVTAVAVGEAIITVRTSDGSNLTATCSVKVNPIKVDGITLSQTAATLYPADELQLTATVSPDNATEKGIVWSSSNTAVATVADGKVVAVAPGEAVITVTSTDGSGVAAQCVITVQPILATSISLSQTAIDAIVGDRLQLTATVLPDNTTDKGISWKSSNTDVAMVDAEGIVVVVGAGSAQITATTNDGSNLSASCAITAVPATILATSVALDITEAEIGIGRTMKVTATVLPEDASTRSVTWSSSNEAVATVNEIGVITAVATGEAVITAATVDGTNISATCAVTVVPVLVESIQLDVTTARLELDKTVQLTATVLPADATNKTVTWSSSDTAVATVDEQGLVTATGVGDAIITAATTDGSNLTATCAITVVPTLAESISLNITDADIEEGKTLQLVATVLPEGTTDKTVIWSSSDSDVATVDATGLVTAIGVGEVTITATTADGSEKSASCTITVLPILVESIALDVTEAVVHEGETLQLTATVLPATATNKDVEWRSSDETIATVDESGLVTTIARGNVVITVSTTDGTNLKGTCAITVTFPVGIKQMGAADGTMQIYTLDGRQHTTLQRGVNIIRMADGTVRRVSVK